MASFRRALALGLSFECDLQLVRTGEVVLLHDDTLQRTAAPWSAEVGPDQADYSKLVTTPVESVSFDEVRRVDVGSWFGAAHGEERVPTFAQGLEALKQAGNADACCFAEIKSADGERGGTGPMPAVDAQLVAAAEAVARGQGLRDEQLVWISFSRAVAVEIKRRTPEHASLLIKHATTSDEAWQAARDCVEHGLDGVDLQADAEIVTAELVDWLKARGKLVAVWVFRAPAPNDTPELWSAMRDAGVAYFTSNAPPEISAVAG